METVKLASGEIVLKEPTAGARNKAMIKADTPGGIKQTVMIVEIIPYCIQSHPFGQAPLRQALDSLSVREYDLILDAVAKMLKPRGDDVLGKSEQPSEEVQLTDGLEKN